MGLQACSSSLEHVQRQRDDSGTLHALLLSLFVNNGSEVKGAAAAGHRCGMPFIDSPAAPNSSSQRWQQVDQQSATSNLDV